MTKRNTHNNHARLRSISRREFIKVAAAAGLVAGCRAVEQSATTPTSQPTVTTLPADTPPPTDSPLPTNTPGPTDTPFPTDTPIPTSTPTPNATPTVAVSRQNIIKMYPDAPSKVVHTRHAGVWDGDTLAPNAIRQMLDASITELTGLNDAHEAWAVMFDPGERIAIKVNTIRESLFSTHIPLVMAVTECLQEADIPAEQIIIFDRASHELEIAGYPVNETGPGVRCYGTKAYTTGWKITNVDIALSDILLSCDALINMPILKVHPMAGITFAMKNHYGTMDKPHKFHTNIGQCITELNALQPIKERTRLIIGDILTIVESGWQSAITTGDSLLMSFDPVAHDAVGLQVFSEAWTAAGHNSNPMTRTVNNWLEAGAALGLGSNDPDNMELVEVNLG